MPKNYIKVEGKKIKIEKLNILPKDREDLFGIAFEVSKDKSKLVSPYVAFKVCLATTKDLMKRRRLMCLEDGEVLNIEKGHELEAIVPEGKKLN